MTVDGEPAVRTCVTPAAGVRRVTRGAGWPSAERDALSILWRLRALMPVGFYYKSMIRPRWVFPIAERVIRRIAGLGPVPRTPSGSTKERMNHHPDVVVIGGGIAGLSAALAAAEGGERVILVEEGAIGERIAPGALRDRIAALRDALSRHPSATILERATAVGIFEGPLVPVVGDDLLHLVHPLRIVVASGAVERHAVFPGNDLPGVLLGRGASRLAGVHGLTPGRAIVVATSTLEGLQHLDVLRRHAGDQRDTAVVAAVVPAALASRVPAGIEVIADGTVVEALGSGALHSVVIEAAGAPPDGAVRHARLVDRTRAARRAAATSDARVRARRGRRDPSRLQRGGSGGERTTNRGRGVHR